MRHANVRDSLVAKKLVPAPTKKLNIMGTARLALTCMLHANMRVEAIVTLRSSQRNDDGIEVAENAVTYPA